MTREQKMDKYSDLLKSIGLPYHDIKVFGAINLNVHIRCKGLETSRKWHSILCRILDPKKVKTVKTFWHAKENKNTCLLPTRVNGYLIGGTL